MESDSPDLFLQCVAEIMAEELESNRLDICLVPSPVEFQPTGRKQRVVLEKNPSWYRRLCADYPSNRRRPRTKRHDDTRIKRRNTLSALKRISQGDASTEYTQRLLPIVEKEAEAIASRYGYLR